MMNVGEKEGQFLVLRVFIPTVSHLLFCLVLCLPRPEAERKEAKKGEVTEGEMEREGRSERCEGVATTP